MAAPADGAERPCSWPSSRSRLCSLWAAGAAGRESVAASGCRVETVVFSRKEKEIEGRGGGGGARREGETDGARRGRVGSFSRER
jgi:hypothetical protein